MFGRVLLEGLFGDEYAVDGEYAFALGQRVGRRSHYIATRLKIMEWNSKEQWNEMREWLLKDLPGEEPLPPLRSENENSPAH
jgi:hypothetical protein